MKKSIATKWVKALRSGEYKQGTGRLKMPYDNKHKYCCLGVLGKISGVNDNILENSECLMNGLNLTCGMHDEKGGTKDNSGIEIGVQTYSCLASANDNGASFEKIANWIEKNYKKL